MCSAPARVDAPGRRRRAGLARAGAAALALAGATATGPAAGPARGDGSALGPVVFADGQGLPAGGGTAARGATLYREACASCHGGRGEGGSAPELVGDPASLDGEYPDRGIGARWPHAPPLFDYVRRAMPPDAPGSLGPDDAYAVVAHLLALNGLLDADGAVDAATLARLRMPVRDRFVDVDVPR